MPPTPDQFEVTVFGAGVGESIVVHVRNGEWLIVDSFWETHRRPAALRYLSSIGVSRDAVSHIVITHWDVDHYRGVDVLLDEYQNARLLITDAMGSDTFRTLAVAPEMADKDLPSLASTIERARERAAPLELDTMLDHVGSGQILIERENLTARALAPTRAAVQRSKYEIAEVLRRGSTEEVRSQLRRDNRSSIVILLAIADMDSAVLLGGDLENDTERFGWSAVLANLNHQHLPKSSLVKVPHHGSDGAHHKGMWDQLVDNDSRLLVAPFWTSGIPKPDSDHGRLLSHGRDLHQAAPSHKPGGIRDRKARARIAGIDIEAVPALFSPRATVGTGRITARRRAGEPDWSIDFSPPAFRVHPQDI